jgi:hypothetical protein
LQKELEELQKLEDSLTSSTLSSEQKTLLAQQSGTSILTPSASQNTAIDSGYTINLSSI